MVDFDGPGTCPEEDSPESQLSDADIASSIPTQTEQEFQTQTILRAYCSCGGLRGIESAKKLLRRPSTYGRVVLKCSSCNNAEEFVFRMDWLAR